MTYPNGAQTVFQVTCMGSVYSVEDGFQCFYIFTTRNVCKSFLRRCKPVNTVFILPRWHPAACQTMPAC